MKSFLVKSGSILLLGLMALPGVSVADAPASESFEERIPVGEPEPVAMDRAASDCGWGTRASLGVPVWFFEDEDTEVGAGGYLDFYPCDMPLNLRVGIEGVHMNLDQPNAASIAEAPGKSPEISFYRIPFAVEYVMPLMEATDLYLGLGPDLIRVANDTSDWSVGMHLSARLAYDLGNNFGLGLEGGYMWGEVDNNTGDDIKLDNAFVIPTLSYSF